MFAEYDHSSGSMRSPAKYATMGFCWSLEKSVNCAKCVSQRLVVKKRTSAQTSTRCCRCDKWTLNDVSENGHEDAPGHSETQGVGTRPLTPFQSFLVSATHLGRRHGEPGVVNVASATWPPEALRVFMNRCTSRSLG